MGPADHAVHEGQHRICTLKSRDKHDVIIVTEKLDGSNVGIARIGDDIVGVGRSGFDAESSPQEQHRLFAAWIKEREDLFRRMLEVGQRLVGEWMAQAHGSKYMLPQGPFAAFDLMRHEKRAPFADLSAKCKEFEVPMPKLLHVGGALPVERAMELHGAGEHGVDEPEGVVYRVERKGEYDFMAKWVRPDKIDGKYLPGVGLARSDVPVWNWRPLAKSE